jgi:hypothetical protein
MALVTDISKLEPKSKKLGDITLYPVGSVAHFLGDRTVQEFKDKVYLEGLIKSYTIRGKLYFSTEHIVGYLKSIES